MPLYSCQLCIFSTNLKSNNNRHQKTMKHHNNLKSYDNDIVENLKKHTNDTQMIHKCKKKIHKRYTKDTQKIHKSICEFCNKEFASRQSMLRHVRLFCKVKKENEAKELENQNQILELKSQVNMLIDKVGSNTIITHNITNNQTNVQLNNFGNEDLSLLTDIVKHNLIKGPYTMMPKLMEMIYFNDKFPKNQTLKLVNRKQNILKVYEEGKWKYVDKDETINNLLDEKNYKVDIYYEDNSDRFSKFVVSTYDKFRELFNSKDKDLWDSIKREVDFLLWNNM